MQLNFRVELALFGAREQPIRLNQRRGEHVRVAVVEDAHAYATGVRVRHHAAATNAAHYSASQACAAHYTTRRVCDAVFFAQASLLIMNINKKQR